MSDCWYWIGKDSNVCWSCATLTNIKYIPNMRRNLISLSVLHTTLQEKGHLTLCPLHHVIRCKIFLVPRLNNAKARTTRTKYMHYNGRCRKHNGFGQSIVARDTLYRCMIDCMLCMMDTVYNMYCIQFMV